MIHLRVRTEHSFRRAYGPVERVADALAALGVKAAGIVDLHGGTWGHVRWEQSLTKRGIRPLFGAELHVEEVRAPIWALAETEVGALYRLTSRETLTTEDIAQARGVVRFAGGAADDPALFDYIDINPASPLSQRRALALHRSTGKPLVLTADNAYPLTTDADKHFALDGSEKTTPQHLLSWEELRAAIPALTKKEFAAAKRACFEVAERCRANSIPKAPLIKVGGDLRSLAREGQTRRVAAGQIESWTPQYEERFEYELGIINEKAYQSYFLVVADLVSWAKQHMLVGPARGSSAGSLICYLTGITEVDPLRHKLLFERFIDVTRADLPDIDIDFSDAKRDLVFGYLADKYGAAHVARLGNIMTLKPTSAINQVTRRLGIPFEDTFALKNVLIDYSSGDSRYGKGIEDTLTTTEPGRRFVEQYPQSMLMTEVEGHAWGTSVHAGGVVVCNEPLTNFCTVRAGVTNLNKPDAEYLNLLKIDALGLRTLGVIEGTECITNDQLYSLTLDDPTVLKVFNDHRYAGIFQFEGSAQRSLAEHITFHSFIEIDHATALARPGPLGGGAADRYLRRARGEEKVEYRHPALKAWLEDTYGLVLYQEQVMRIVRELGKFSWADTTIIRKAMSGRKGAEYFDRLRTNFIEGAQESGVSKEVAQAIWFEIFNFGAWGMNRSHTVSYAVISYWCAHMKVHFPLEYAAACLRQATSDEQALGLLRELVKEGVKFVPLDPDRSDVNWTARDGKLLGGIQNADGYGPIKAAHYVEARNANQLTDKERERLAATPVKFSNIFPARTEWGHLYDDPSKVGCRAGTVIKQIAELEENEECVIIGQLVEKKRRDMNESILIKRRNGKVIDDGYTTLFADVRVIDDSAVAPIILRIDRWDWKELGEPITERAVAGKDWFIVRGKKLRGFPMIKVFKIKCLNREDLLHAQT